MRGIASGLGAARGIILTGLAALALAHGAPAASASQQTCQAGPEPGLEGIEALVETAMKDWAVPGVAVGVIRDGAVALERGYGYRDLDDSLPVTERTLFAIGSITKSFTVTALGMLEDEGRLEWDAPVRRYLPDFELKDPVAAQRMSVRDLLTHRSGLPRHDFVWYGSELTRDELYRRIRYLEPSADFRSVYQYQNLMFMTAGYLAGRQAGVSWESLIGDRILKPLGMERTNFSVNSSQRADDFAYPYVKVGGEVRGTAFRNVDAVGPAGSINSSVTEMLRYLQLHIGEGSVDGRRLLSIENAREMRIPQIVVPAGESWPELGRPSYGMGFILRSYCGHDLIYHGGGIDGFVSMLSFMPESRTGVVVLTNLSGQNPLPALLTYHIYDRLLGHVRVDWSGRFRQRAEEGGSADGDENEIVRVEGTRPSHELREYTGTYVHAAYGAVLIETSREELRMTFHGITTPLRHFHYDVFAVPDGSQSPFGELKVMFLYDKAGRIDRIAIALEPAVPDIVFTRSDER